jgi:hypothetical protein
LSILRQNNLFVELEFQSITDFLDNWISKLTVGAADAATSIGKFGVALFFL